MIKDFKGFVGLEEQKEPGVMDDFSKEFNEYCSLTRTQRMYGFAICFVLGLLVSLLSTLAIPALVSGEPARFAIFYTFGNLLGIGSTCFLWGPCSQLKQMFKPVRAVATLVYFISMGLTLFCAFKVQSAGLVILCIIIQMCALFYYALTYIPYGRTMLKKCLGSMAGLVVVRSADFDVSQLTGVESDPSFDYDGYDIARFLLPCNAAEAAGGAGAGEGDGKAEAVVEEEEEEGKKRKTEKDEGGEGDDDSDCGSGKTWPAVGLPIPVRVRVVREYEVIDDWNSPETWAVINAGAPRPRSKCTIC